MLYPGRLLRLWGVLIPVPTRVAIFGDLHGNVAATAAVLADIAASEPAAVYCLGDLVGYGACPNETVALIAGRGIPAIMGNYDDGVGSDREECGCAYNDADEAARGRRSLRWTRRHTTDAHKAYLRLLPAERRFKLGPARVRLVHGSPRRMNEYLFEDRDPGSLERIARGADCDVLVFGHTHKPWVKEIAGVLMVNAGSVGKPKDGDPRAAWVMLELDGRSGVRAEIRRTAYEAAAMAAAIRAADGLPDQYALDLETGGQ